MEIYNGILLLVILFVQNVWSLNDCLGKPLGYKVQDQEDCHGYYICLGAFGEFGENCGYGYKFSEVQQRCIIGKCPPCLCTCQSQTTEQPCSYTETTTTEPDDKTSTSTEWDSLTTKTCGCKETTPTSESTNSPSTYGSTHFPATSSTEMSSKATSCPLATTEVPSEATTQSTTLETFTRNSCQSSPPDCSHMANGALIRDSADCNKFYTCLNGKAVPRYCDHGMYFDDKTFVCNFAGLVDCETCKDELTSLGTSSTTEGLETSSVSSLTEMSSKATSCPPATTEVSSEATKQSTTLETFTRSSCQSSPPDCSQMANGALVRDSADCNKFYVCSNGEAVARNCGPGMYFDVNAFVCNFAALVDCESCKDQSASVVTSSTTEGLAPCSASSSTEVSSEATTQSTTLQTFTGSSCQSSPPDCSQMENGAFVRDSADCSKFYVCSNGEAVARNCGPGMYFDVNAFVCNFAALVDCESCKDQSASVVTSSTTEGLAPCSASSSTETSSQATPCPLATTEVSSEATTQSTTLQTFTGSSCQSSPPDCSQIVNGAFVRDSADCSKFYVCSNGEAVARNCGPGMYFDVNAFVCNFAALVDCESCKDQSASVVTSSTTEGLAPCSASSSIETSSQATPCPLATTEVSSEATTQSTTLQTFTGSSCQSSPPDCSQMENGAFVRDSADCSKFYVCSNGEAVARNCGPGMYFDVNAFVCNFAALVDCESCKDQSTSLVTSSTTEGLAPCSASSSTETSSQATSCPLATTELSSEETTQSTTLQTFTGSSCQSSPPDCSQIVNGAFVRDSADCSKFYVCSNGEAVARNCGPGMYFDVNAFVCNFAALVDCESCKDQSASVVTSSTTEGLAPCSASSSTETSSQATPCPLATTEVSSEATTQSTTLQTFTGSSCQSSPPDCSQIVNGAFVRDSADCSKFYVCSNGEAVARNCGPGMYFDVNAFVCNFAALVDCESCKDQSASVVTSSTTEGLAPCSASSSTETSSQATPCPLATTEVSSEATTQSTTLQKFTGSSCQSSPPDCSQIVNGAFVRDSADCSKFYVCSNGEAVARNCGPGMSFDVNAFVCNFAALVDCENCKDQSTSAVTSRTTEDLAPFSASSSTETSSQATSCPVASTEVSPEATTQSTTLQTFTGSSCQSSPPDCSQIVNGAFVRDSADCSKFYVCSNGEAVARNCGPGMYFDVNAFVCNFAALVDCESCKDQSASVVTSSTTEGLAPCSASSSTETSSQATPCPLATTEVSSEATTQSTTLQKFTGSSCQSSPPDCSQIVNGAFVRDSADCSKFYVCSNGEAVARNCGPGMSFDVNAFVCNFAALVDCENCKDQSTSAVTSRTTEDLAPFSASSSTETSSQATSCPVASTEVSPEATTQSTTLQTFTGSSCQSSPPDCSQIVNGAFVRDSADCSKFYVCSNGEAVARNCGPGMYFDVNAFVCNFAALVDCESCKDQSASVVTSSTTEGLAPCSASSSTETSSQATPCPLATTEVSSEATTQSTTLQTFTESSCQSSPPDCSQIVNGAFVRDSADCSKFYVCSNGEAVARNCGPGMYFDVNAFVCNFAGLVDCEICKDQSTNVATTTTTSSWTSSSTTAITTQSSDLSTDSNYQSAVPDCSDLANGAFVRDSADCSKFYVCSNGKPVARNCGPGMYFDDKAFVCNFAGLVECQNSDNSKTLSTQATASTLNSNDFTVLSENCFGMPHGSYVRDTNQCSKYYICLNGKAITQYCAPGLWFDNQAFVCNFKSLVQNCPANHD